MNRLGRPFNEEREERSGIFLECESLPLKDATVGSPAGTGSGAGGGDARFREFCGEGLQIAGMCGSADQARLGQFIYHGVLLRAGLLGVRGNDFKIPPWA